MYKFFIRHPQIALGGLLLSYLLFSGGWQEIQQYNTRSDALKQQRQGLQDKRLQLELEQAAAAESAAIAESRLKSGCVFVYALSEPDFFTSLTEGQPVLDAIRSVPLTDGNRVCDRNGMTGVIVDGVVDKTAFTGNQDAIQAAIERSGAKGFMTYSGQK